MMLFWKTLGMGLLVSFYVTPRAFAEEAKPLEKARFIINSVGNCSALKEGRVCHYQASLLEVDQNVETNINVYATAKLEFPAPLFTVGQVIVANLQPTAGDDASAPNSYLLSKLIASEEGNFSEGIFTAEVKVIGEKSCVLINKAERIYECKQKLNLRSIQGVQRKIVATSFVRKADDERVMSLRTDKSYKAALSERSYPYDDSNLWILEAWSA